MSTRRVLAVVLGLLSLASFALLGRLEVDNRLERWFDDTGDSARIYEAFRQTYGSDEFLLAVIDGGSFFDPVVLQTLLDAAESLEEIPGVTRVDGLPMLYRDLFGAEDPEALEAELAATGFFDGLFVSADRTEAAVWMTVEAADEARSRRRIVRAADAALNPVREAGRSVQLVGSPALIVALDEVSQRQARKTLPLALIGSVLVLAWMLRSLRAMVAPVVAAGMTIGLTLGAAALLGRTMNMVTTALPPLLWVLTLSNGLFIVRRYQAYRRRRPPTPAMTAALAETTRPCVLAGVTTATGFGSLVVSGMAPVREFGWLAAGGVLMSIAVNLLMIPVITVALRAPAVRRVRRRGGAQWSNLVRRPGWVVAGALLVMAGGLAALPFLKVDSNPVDFLPADHSTTEAYRSFRGEIGGYYTLEVLINPPAPWFHSDVWPVIDGLSERVEAEDIVTKVLSPVDVLRLINRWEQGFTPGSFEPPATEQACEALLSSVDPAVGGLLDRLVEVDGRQVRLSAMIREMEEGRFLDLAQSVERDLARLPAGWTGVVTGQVLGLVGAQQTLVRTQIRSFGLAFVLVFACIAVGLRSRKLTLAAIIPNLVPTLTTFGVMALLKIPLNAATVMVASIALGIAVDNTVHVLEHVRRRVSEGLSMSNATTATLGAVGPAMVTTTASACAGFLALCLSDFAPIRSFGFLASVAIAAALIADRIVLPAILEVYST